MQEANKFKLGLFVISAITVLVIVVSCMGMFDQLKPKAHLVTYVEAQGSVRRGRDACG